MSLRELDSEMIHSILNEILKQKEDITLKPRKSKQAMNISYHCTNFSALIMTNVSYVYDVRNKRQ